MDQVKGGDLIVNRGDESKPKEDPASKVRELNAVEGYEVALKLAEVHHPSFNAEYHSNLASRSTSRVW